MAPVVTGVAARIRPGPSALRTLVSLGKPNPTKSLRLLGGFCQVGKRLGENALLLKRTNRLGA